MPNLSFGYGCRCCYDTTDGGEYMALTDLRAKMEQEKGESVIGAFDSPTLLTEVRE